VSALATAPFAGERLSAHERLERLCDRDSLQLIRPDAASVRRDLAGPPGDGVLAGIGRVGGRPIACYAQDGVYAGGSVGEAHAETIVRLLQIAGRARLPVLSVIHSAGARMQEGIAALGALGRVFLEMVILSGQVPQIAVVAGPSAGGGSYSAALADFVVMTEGASMFLTGPEVVRDALGEAVSGEELGGSSVHERNGICDVVAAGDDAALAAACRLLSFLPGGGPCPAMSPAPAGDVGAYVPVEQRRSYDVRAVARALADGGEILETGQRWARNLVTAFCRLEGRSVGLVANQPCFLGGVIDCAAARKASRFVRTCDSLGVPLVALVDTPGFMPGRAQERAGVIGHGADLLRAFASARVPRVSVVLRKAFGGAYITMNSRDLGATLTFAWPGAQIGVMAAESAVGIIHRDALRLASDPGAERARLAREYGEDHHDVRRAAAEGLVDAVVRPAETRTRIAEGLGALCGEISRPQQSTVIPL
jgi:acetyl-CoA carboxylase carboxyltransferase component